MKAAVPRLPAGYRRVRRIDLLKNQRELRTVAVISLILPALWLAGTAVLTPLASAKALVRERPWSLLLLAVALIAYIVLHELVHGAFIHVFSGRPARFGFNWAYAYAASDFCFAKRPYLVIALAPALFWGVAFAVGQGLAAGGWVWWMAVLQAMNLSGAAGDFYTAWVVAHMPDSVLIRDAGISMEIFDAQAAPGADAP